MHEVKGSEDKSGARIDTRTSHDIESTRWRQPESILFSSCFFYRSRSAVPTRIKQGEWGRAYGSSTTAFDEDEVG